jgi:glutamyl-tRNA synthetase
MGYRESGYLPEAVMNFLALLGWNPGNDQEIMSVDELIKLFDLKNCSKSGAKFDYEKGKWFNHQYIQKYDNKVLAGMLLSVLEKKELKDISIEYVTKVVGLMKERMNLIPDFWRLTYYFFITPSEYDEKTVKKRWKPDSALQLRELIEVLESCNPFDVENTEAIVKAWIEEKGYNLGAIMNAFRLALVGQAIGPHIFVLTEAIGKEETIRRIEQSIKVLG